MNMGKDRGSPGILHKGCFVFDVQLRTVMSRMTNSCFYFKMFQVVEELKF